MSDQVPGHDSDVPAVDIGTESPEPPAGGFDRFGLHPVVLQNLEKMQIRTPTPIQEKVIGPILEGKDVIGKAETGTGKTIGFGGPIAGKIDTNRVAVQAIVLTPTRELAQQVSSVMEQLGEGLGLRVAMVVGGVHASEQIAKLRGGSQVVVGTPGRILDFLKERTLSLSWCEVVVIDEADRLFDMGFIDDMRAILDHTPQERQTLLFSATIPPEIQKLMKQYMRDPETYSTAKGLATVPDIRQVYREVGFPDKFRELCAIIDESPDETVIVFTNTRHQAIDLDRMLFGHEYAARALHGEHEQEVRFQILESFRNRDIRVLVATDVAARGLDIDDVAKVVNYEVPIDVESYVHRIGRTGRASKRGVAITLVAGKEAAQWQRIISATRFPIEKEKAVTPPSSGPGRGGRDPRSRGRHGDRAAGGGRGRDRPRGRRRGRHEPRRESAGAAGAAEREAPRERREPREKQDAAPSGPERGSRRRSGRSGPAPARAGDTGKREDALFSNPLKSRREAAVGPVSSDVDLFDISMRDFLDHNLEMDDFTGPPPESEAGPSATPAPERGGAREGEGEGESESGGAPRKKRRRRRRRGGRDESRGQARPAEQPDAKAGEGASKKGRRRRRRRRSREPGQGEARQ